MRVGELSGPRSAQGRRRGVDLFDLAWPLVALMFGLVTGSFANVCIHRLPLRQSVVHPRSYCPRCQAPIPAWRNLPVLGYVLLGGRSACCASPISPRYPLVEAANGALYFALAAKLGPSRWPW